MIVLQSTATSRAERPADNPKSARGMSSLEERGEGSSHRSMAEADKGELNICRSRDDEALIAKPLAIPQPKSTLPHPKSTVDLGCEGLIWVENTLISSRLGDPRRAFCPITTESSGDTEQNQTNAGRKIFFTTVDLGLRLRALETWFNTRVNSCPPIVKIKNLNFKIVRRTGTLSFLCPAAAGNIRFT